MADVESNINIDINTSNALASLRNLQREISQFHQVMSKTGAVSNSRLRDMQQNLVNGVNSTGQFTATLQKVTTTTESFTNALEKNKLSMGQYFKYAGASTKTFGRLFRNEFDTIEKVARERVKTLQTQYIKLGRDANGAMQAIAVRPQVLDMKDLGTQTAMAAQKAQLFNQLMKQGSTDLLNFGKNTQWAGRQLMVGFTIPLGIMGAAAAKEFKAIEEQVLRLQRVYGDFTTTVGETEQVTEQLKGLATEFTKYGVSVAKTMSLAADAAAMGKTGAELTAQVAEANRLAVLGGVDQQQSLETTISLTNAFGVSADKLAGKVNFLNAVENQTVTSIQDLTEAIPKAGPVVQQLGGNVEDLAFFMTAMKEGGIDAGEGANALKSGLASIINPTQEAVDMLNSFNINVQAIRDNNAGNVSGMVKELATQLNALDPLNRAQAIETMFGKFQFARMSTLFQNVVAEGTQASRVLDLTKASASELAALSQKELAKLESSPLYQFEGAIERFKASLAPVGEEFMKAVTPLINFGTDILNAFNNMEGGVKQFIVIVTGAVAGIGPVLLMTFGLLANGIANIIKGFMLLKNLFSGTGRSTNVLAEQTNYMTTQQLEAAAVASSLGQVHTSLIQTFNAEAASIRNLAAAYQSAIVAQGAFGGPIVGGGKARAPKKMATGGIFKGPGTGTSDSIPAMVSDGEAIIPAANVRKYPELTYGLIAGNIPGFKDGHFAHIGPGKSFTGSQLLAMPGLTGLTDSVRNKLEVLSKITPNAKADILHSWGVQMNSKVNQNLANLRGATPGAEASALATQFSGRDIAARYGEAAKLSGADINDAGLQKEIAAYDKAMSAKIRDMKKNGIERFVDTDAQLKALPEAQRKLVGSLETVDRETVKEIGKENKKLVAFRKKAISTVRDVRIGPGLTQQQRDAIMNDPEGNRVLGRGYDGGTKRKVGQSDQATKSGGYGVMSSAAVKANEESVKTTKKRTATSKKIIEQETQMLKDEKKSAAAKRGWETRRARQAALEASQGSASATKPGIGSRLAGKTGMIGMGLSGAMMAGSMVGGPVGDILGTISGPLMGVGMAMQMIPGPAGMVVAGLAAVAGVAMVMKQKFDEAQRAAEDFAVSTQGSTQAINALAEASGKTTASQTMDQRRAAASEIAAATEEQNAVAQAYLGSETGKTMMTALADSIKNGNGQSGISNIANQMATAISQGAISAVDAKAVIQNIGSELGDSSFSLKATARLEELIGPNGEDLAKDPIGVRLNVMKGQAKGMKASGTSLENLGIGATGVLGGMAIGAGAGSIIPGVGTGLGAALGLAVGGTIELFSYYEKLGAASGAFASNVVIASQQSQQMLDSLQLDYETRIAAAKAAGDTAEADRLSEEYVAGRQKILAQSAKDQKAAADSYGKLSGEKQTSVIGSLDQQIKDMYAEGPMKAIAEQAISQIGGMTLDGSTVEFTLKSAVASGDIDPTTMNNTLDLISAGNGNVQVVADIITKVGTADADRIMQFAAFADKPEQSVTFMTSMQDLTPEASAKVLNTLDIIGKYGGEAALNVAVESDVSKINEIQASIDAVDSYFADGQQKVYSVDMKFGSQGFELTAAQAEYFNGLSPADQKTYTTSYVTTIETIDLNTPQGRERLREYARNKEGADYYKTGKYSKNSVINGKTYKTDYAAIARDMAAEQAAAAVSAQQAAAASAFQGGGSSPVTSGGGGGASSQPDLPTLAEQYQAALKLISDQEDEINKKYEQRLKALDEIQEAQEAITAQQKDQLDVQDALSKGDISAAVRAQQSARENAAKRAQEQQRKALEMARSAELANTTYNGYTRAWYESQLKALEAAENARIAAGQAKATGGIVLGPGTGTSDSIPAMLSNGEYVIRAAAVKALGVNQLNMLNNIDRMGYANGGKVARIGGARRFNTAGLSAPQFRMVAKNEIDPTSIANSAAPVIVNNTPAGSNSVYNYSVNVNAATSSDPNQIANAVMKQIRNVESRRARGNYING